MGTASDEKSKPGPIRTCLGCGSTDEKSRLVRLVADVAGRVRVDKFQKLAGRGAYVHGERGCVDRMMDKDRLGRSLKRKLVSVAQADLWDRVVDGRGGGGAGGKRRNEEA